MRKTGINNEEEGKKYHIKILIFGHVELKIQLAKLFFFKFMYEYLFFFHYNHHPSSDSLFLPRPIMNF